MAFRGAPVGHPLKSVTRKDTMEITPEIQAAIDAAVETATKKLNDKNAELRDENRTLKTAKTAAEQAAESAAQEAAEKSGNVDSVKAQLTAQHEKALKLVQDELSATNARLSSMTREATLNEALTAANVRPQDVPLVKAYLASNAKYENGEWSVEGTALRDHADAWLKSKDAAHYIAAPANSGAGATGSNATAASPVIKTIDEYTRLALDNPEGAKSATLDPSLEYLRKS